MVRSHETRDAILFLLPLGILYMAFLHGPIIGAIYVSFTSYDIITPPDFVGLGNYIRFFSSERTLGIYATTFQISAILIVLHASIGLVLALSVMSLNRKYQGFYRIVLYAPVVITTASMAIAWHYMFNRDFGVFNWALRSMGFQPIAWLTSSRYVFTSISIFSVWKFIGNSFIYYYIGLKSIPDEYYEVAYIEGAGPLDRFRHVTFPLLTPTIFFVLMILCIQTIQIFDEPFFLTRGGPGDASRTVNLHIYEVAFRSYDMGYSAAIAVTLLLVLLTFTLIQTNLSKRWVNYDR